MTKLARTKFEIQDVWQRNYYEHIIGNEDSYHKISDYIRNNPSQWQEDEYFNEIH